jgi:hypothetical protein
LIFSIVVIYINDTWVINNGNSTFNAVSTTSLYTGIINTTGRINVGNDVFIDPTTGLAGTVTGCPIKYGIKLGYTDSTNRLSYMANNNISNILANLSDVTANGIGIVNSGNNANGTWVKFGNGLLILKGIIFLLNSSSAILSYDNPS